MWYGSRAMSTSKRPMVIRDCFGTIPCVLVAMRFYLGGSHRSDGAATVNQALYRGRGHQEPWYLATSLSDAKVAARHYRQRMQPEQYFRDGKQYFA